MKLNLVRYSEGRFEDLDVEVRVYRGTGSINVQTPNGEVKACSGDLILELPSGPLVLKQMDAIHLFGPGVESLLLTPSTDSTKESPVPFGDIVLSLGENLGGSSASSVPVVEGLGKLPDDSLKSGAETAQSSTQLDAAFRAVANSNSPTETSTKK